RRRELLAHAAHRLAGRARGDETAIGQDDVVGTLQSELVGDVCADGSRSRYRDSSHCSSSERSVSNSVRNGRLTSSRTGTPRRPRQNFAAAWNGKRSSTARTSPTSPERSRTSRATSSGKTAASPETA